MRRIAVINQKGGVGKTTTSANLGAALAQQGRRVVLIDMDAQANLSISLGTELAINAPSTYTVLLGESTILEALRPTAIEGLSLIASNIDLSGAELELAGAIGREHLMRDALAQWESEHRKTHGRSPADYVIFDCPPSLGLLSINALAAAGEVLITLQTEFLALQGMTKLVDVVQLLRRRVNPELVITGILPCLYDSRLKLAREVLGEIRSYFGAQVFPHPVRTNVKLAEAPSFGKTIFEYAPDSNGAQDYMYVAREVMLREGRDADLAGLPPYREGRALRVEPRTSEMGDVAPAIAPIVSTMETSLGVPATSGIEPMVEVEPTTNIKTRVKAKPKTNIEAASNVNANVGASPTADVAPVEKEASTSNEPVTRAESKRRGARHAATNGVTKVQSATSILNATPVADPAPVSNATPLPSTTPVPTATPATRKAGKRSERATPAGRATTPVTTARATVTPVVPNDAASVRQEPEAKRDAPEVAPRVDEEKALDRAPRAKPLNDVILTPAARDPLRRIVRAEDLPPLPPDAFEILTNYVRDV